MKNQQGMALIVTLIFMIVLTILVLGAMENTWLNQKTANDDQSMSIALNSAEAGIRAAEAEINGKSLELTGFKANINFQISEESVDECQQHIFSINSLAWYQNARVKIESHYLQAHQPPLLELECTPSISHRLWWAQTDI